MENRKLEILLTELQEAKENSAYSQNHLLNTVIERTEELIKDKFDTETKIGF